MAEEQSKPATFGEWARIALDHLWDEPAPTVDPVAAAKRELRAREVAGAAIEKTSVIVLTLGPGPEREPMMAEERARSRAEMAAFATGQIARGAEIEAIVSLPVITPVTLGPSKIRLMVDCLAEELPAKASGDD